MKVTAITINLQQYEYNNAIISYDTTAATSKIHTQNQTINKKLRVCSLAGVIARAQTIKQKTNTRVLYGIIDFD